MYFGEVFHIFVKVLLNCLIGFVIVQRREITNKLLTPLLVKAFGYSKCFSLIHWL